MSAFGGKADVFHYPAKGPLLAEGVEELCCQQPANVIPFFLVVLRKEHGNDGTRSRTTRPTFL